MHFPTAWALGLSQLCSIICSVTPSFQNQGGKTGGWSCKWNLKLRDMKRRESSTCSGMMPSAQRNGGEGPKWRWVPGKWHIFHSQGRNIGGLWNMCEMRDIPSPFRSAKPEMSTLTSSPAGFRQRLSTVLLLYLPESRGALDWIWDLLHPTWFYF